MVLARSISSYVSSGAVAAVTGARLSVVAFQVKPVTFGITVILICSPSGWRSVDMTSRRSCPKGLHRASLISAPLGAAFSEGNRTGFVFFF